jgi:hypothetical protein
MSRLRSRLAGVTGTTEETDLIKLRLKRISAEERSDVRKAYDPTENTVFWWAQETWRSLD